MILIYAIISALMSINTNTNITYSFAQTTYYNKHTMISWILILFNLSPNSSI